MEMKIEVVMRIQSGENMKHLHIKCRIDSEGLRVDHVTCENYLASVMTVAIREQKNT